MKIYSINEQNNELLIYTFRDCDYLDNVSPSLPKFSVIADAKLPALTEKQALIVVGERSSYQYMKDNIEITVNNVFLASKNLQIVEDHRSETYYSTTDGFAVEIKDIGPLPDNVTDQQKPEGFYTWDGNTWVEDTEAKNEAYKMQLESELAQLKQDMIFSQMMGDDVSGMIDRVKEIREELASLE